MADLLYLVRHGEARSKQEDPNRGLTDAGRAAAERMARWAVTAGVAADEIRHSGKLRAEQTAAVFAEYLHPRGPEPVAMSGLGPNDDVEPVARVIEEEDRSLMLVGHLPFLARLVAYLVTGSPGQPMVQFDAAAMVALRREDEQWEVTCVMQPSTTPLAN
jgi:phosphohistidine phosphatase